MDGWGEMGTKSLWKNEKEGENLTNEKRFEEDVKPQRGFRC